MSVTDNLIKYFASSYAPIRISAPRDEWRKLKYRNLIFGASVNYSEHWLDDAEVIFSANMFGYCYCPDYLMHPLTYVHSIVRDPQVINHRLKVDVHNKENVMVTVDTEGLIPNRWIRMLADFGLNNATIDENSRVPKADILKYWSDKIHALPPNMIENIARNCWRIMEDQMIRLRVIKAPPYSLDCAEYTEIKCKVKNADASLRNRKWGTYDGLSEPAAQIFFKKCAKYVSFCAQGEQPYYQLFACEGGISLHYLQSMPWIGLRECIFDSGNGYCDVRGHDEYYPRKDTPFEEIIVMAEALKKEGAVIELVNTNSAK